MNKGFSVTLRPRFRDTDGMGHVNNAVFLTYLETARSDWFLKIYPEGSIHDFDFIIARIEIDYKDQIDLRSLVEVRMWVSRIGNKSWDFSYQLTDINDGRIYAEAKTVQVSFDYKTKNTTKLSETILDLLRGMYRD